MLLTHENDCPDKCLHTHLHVHSSKCPHISGPPCPHTHVPVYCQCNYPDCWLLCSPTCPLIKVISQVKGIIVKSTIFKVNEIAPIWKERQHVNIFMLQQNYINNMVELKVFPWCNNQKSLICLASNPGPVFCLLLGVISDYAQPITDQVTEVTCPVIGWAQPELTPSKRQKTGPGHISACYGNVEKC